MIEFKNVSKKFKKNVVLNNLNFKFSKGDFILITGKNGSGKSTLIKLILSQYNKSSGEILVNTNKIAYISENISLPENITLKTYLLNYSKFLKVKYDEVLVLLNKYKLTKYEHVMIKNLSKGTRQKVGLITVSLKKYDVLICDELISGLDLDNQEEIKDFIRSNLKNETLVILSTHFIDIYLELNPKIYVVDEGELRNV